MSSIKSFQIKNRETLFFGVVILTRKHLSIDGQFKASERSMRPKKLVTCNFVQSSSLCYLWVPSPHPCLLIFPVPIYSQSIDEFASGVEIVDHFSALSASQEIEKRGFILIFSKATFPCVDGKELAYEFLVYSLMH